MSSINSAGSDPIRITPQSTPTENLKEAEEMLPQLRDKAMAVVEKQLGHLEKAYEHARPKTIREKFTAALKESGSHKQIKKEIRDVRQIKTQLERAISVKKGADSVKLEKMISDIQDYGGKSVLREPLLSSVHIDLSELRAERTKLARDMGKYREIITKTGLQIREHGMARSLNVDRIRDQSSRASSVFKRVFQGEKDFKAAVKEFEEARRGPEELKTDHLYADLKTEVEKFSREEAQHKLHKGQYERVETFFGTVESKRDTMTARLINTAKALKNKREALSSDIRKIEEAKGAKKEKMAKAAWTKWLPLTKTRKEYKATQKEIDSLEREKAQTEKKVRIVTNDLKETKAMIDRELIGADKNLGRIMKGTAKILADAEKGIKRSLKGPDQKLEGSVSKILKDQEKVLDDLFQPADDFMKGINFRYRSHL